MNPKLYFAAPLFSSAERRFNEQLASDLRRYFSVYLPQEDGGLMVEMVGRGMDPDLAATTVFNLDMIAIRDCEVLLIVMDGRTIDEGAAFELGYAHALGKFCVGLQTDPRRLIISRNNPMIDAPLNHVFSSVASLLEWAESFARPTRQCADSKQFNPA